MITFCFLYIYSLLPVVLIGLQQELKNTSDYNQTPELINSLEFIFFLNPYFLKPSASGSNLGWFIARHSTQLFFSLGVPLLPFNYYFLTPFWVPYFLNLKSFSL